MIRTRKGSGSGSSDVSAQMAELQRRLTVAYSSVVPTEGMAVSCPSTDQDVDLQLKPATDLNLITVTLPPESVSRLGQRVFIRSTRQIAEMDVSGATTVDNWSVMFNPGDCVVFFKSDTNTWSRVV